MISLDTSHEVICDNALALFLVDPLSIPWKQTHIHSLLSQAPALIDAQNQSVNFADVVAQGKHVALYFTAGWHDASREYTEKLANVYELLRSQTENGQANKGLEVIYVGMDSSAEDFHNMRQRMPWLSIPFEDAQRRQLLQLIGRAHV